MWQEVSQSFGKIAREYDTWYQDNPIFDSEVAALKALGTPLLPALEVGVGTGAFAATLGFSYGLDPSFDMILIAKEKGIDVVCGLAEEIPFKNESFNSCGIFFVLCFLGDPKQALLECYRILKPSGKLFLGIIPRESPWGIHLAEKGRKGHPLYRYANFLRGKEILNLLAETGFSFKEGFSSLFQTPTGKPKKERPREGLSSQAGFWAILAEKL